MRKGKDGIYCRYIKRILDVLLSGCALVVLSPVLAVTAILVRIKLGSPVIFCQERVTKDQRRFMVYKFRSMSDERNEKGELLPDSERLTTFGRLLRTTSLDELPELWNIFKGDMSIVGPRPLPSKYLGYYNEEEQRRHDVYGGLTGLAQINGRNSTTWEERFAFDVYYAENVSFFLDSKICLLTIKTVLSHRGIGERGVSSPPDFHKYRAKEVGAKEKIE